MSSKVLALSVLLACGSQAQPQQATIEGDANQIQMRVPGATFTFASDDGAGAGGSDWSRSYVATDLLTDTVTDKVNVNSEFMVMPDKLNTKLEAYATQTGLGDAKVASKILITSASIAGCDASTGQIACSSGNTSFVASFYAFGFVPGQDDLYTCVVEFNKMQYRSPVSTEIVGERTVASCSLPAAYHDEVTTFEANVYVIEGADKKIPYSYTNPLIKYFNEGPMITGFSEAIAAVTGEDSLLSALDNQTVSVQMIYNDYYDDVADLKVAVSAVTQNAIQSFSMDTDTQILSIRFVKSWMKAFLARTDENEDGVIETVVSITFTVTDLHDTSTSAELAFTLVHSVPFWNSVGNSKLLSNTARNLILTRLGVKTSAKLDLCYNMAADGWSVSKFHSQCDSKGTLLMLLRTANSDRYFGGYYMASLTSTCNYLHIGETGYVADGVAAPDSAWMFNVMDNAPDAVNFAHQNYESGTYKYAYYQCTNYHLTFGGGFDWRCTDTQCYCNPGFVYRTGSDNVDPPDTFCTGTRYTYPQTTGSGFAFYEVYVVKPE